MKIIWWNGPKDIKATKSEESKPTVPWKGRNESPLIDIHSSIKAIHQSVIDIMDIHNSNMDVYNPVMYIHSSITDIQTYIIIIITLWLSIIVVNHIHNWIADVRNCIKDDLIMDP